jgi:hypothetical protein
LRRSGIARSTINRGIAELKAGSNELGERVRRRGGGRKSAVELQPDLLAALEKLIEGTIRGDPQSPLRWVSRSQRNIVAALRQQGFAVSQKLVGLLLRALDYSCQANRKTREGAQHPDRNAQFEYLNAKVKAALAAGQPAISVDTKKKELVGDFKNGGRELRRKGWPVEACDEAKLTDWVAANREDDWNACGRGPRGQGGAGVRPGSTGFQFRQTVTVMPRHRGLNESIPPDAAWIVATRNGRLVDRRSRTADDVCCRSAAGKPVRIPASKMPT